MKYKEVVLLVSYLNCQNPFSGILTMMPFRESIGSSLEIYVYWNFALFFQSV